MDIKKLEKATNIFNSIKQMDAEIIEIEKMAMILANNDTESSFELNIVDNSQPEEPQNQDNESIDDPNSMAGMLFAGIFRHVTAASKPDKNKHTLSCNLSVTASLQILGVLLYEKQNKRTALINRLKKYGVNV